LVRYIKQNDANEPSAKELEKIAHLQARALSLENQNIVQAELLSRLEAIKE
jgi:hypothetical protein